MSSKKRSAWRWVGVAVAVASGMLFVQFFLGRLEQMPQLDWSARTLGVLLLAGGVYSFLHIGIGAAWHIMLRGMGASSQLLPAVGVVTLSQFAKYLPGNVGHLALRVVMGQRLGLAASRVMATLVLEAALLICTAGAAAVLLMLVAPTGPTLPEDYRVWIAGGFAAAASVVVVALGLRAVPWHRIFSRSDRLNELASLVRSGALGPRSVLSCVLLYATSLSAGGVALDMVAVQICGAESHLVMASATFAAAWAVGFVVPGAPGGLGPRDATMVLLLGGVYGPGEAVLATAFFRLVSSAGDCVAFLVGGFLRLRLIAMGSWPVA